MKIHLTFQKASKHADIPSRSDFYRWVKGALSVIESPAKTAELCIRVVDKAEGAELNQTFRHKSGATNILSFPLLEENTPNDHQTATDIILGDLVICAPVVHAEAEAEGKSALSHWAHLTVHGTLHLLGHIHDTEADASVMEAHEIEILKNLGCLNPYE